MRLRRLIPRRYKLLGLPAGVWVAVSFVAVLFFLGLGPHRTATSTGFINEVVCRFNGRYFILPSGLSDADFEPVASIQAASSLRQFGWPFVLAEEETLWVSMSSLTNPNAKPDIGLDEIRDSLDMHVLLRGGSGELISDPELAPLDMTLEVTPRRIIGIGVVATIGLAIALPLFVWSLLWWLDRIRLDLGQTRRAAALDRGVCPSCKYDIRDLPEPRCPECGEGLESESESR